MYLIWYVYLTLYTTWQRLKLSSSYVASQCWAVAAAAAAANSSRSVVQLSAQLWSHRIKVSSIQAGLEDLQWLMGLYTRFCCTSTEVTAPRYASRSRQGNWDWNKIETKAVWLIMWVGGQVFGSECCVAMAICLFTHPRVMGRGSISMVSFVQEAVEIRALICQYWYTGEEWEQSLGLLEQEYPHTHTHIHIITQTHSHLYLPIISCAQSI